MKRLGLFLLFCSFTYITFAQTSVWKVQKDKKTFYLGGSVHLLRHEDYPMPAAFEKAFNESETIVFEADLDQIGSIPMEEIMPKMIYQDDRTLKSVLSEEVYEKLLQLIVKHDIKEEDIIKMKPSMLINAISLLEMSDLDFSAKGVDMYFFEKAQKENKKISFLESVEYQLDIIFNMGEGYENEFVKYSISDVEDIKTGILSLIADWKKGEKTSVEEQLNEMEKSFPKVYDDLMVKRNNEWLPIIEKYHENNESVFIIVGLAHMYNNEGLLKQLKDKGYKIKQMK